MNWKLWVGTIIGGLFLYLAVRGIDLQELGEALKNANYLYLIPGAFLTLLSVWIRAYRWHYLVHPIRPIGMRSLFSATAIGLMANNLLPARLGEFVRAYVIGEKENISKSASFATIVLERIFDGITILLFLSIVLIAYSFSLPDWMRNAAYMASSIYVIALAFLILLKTRTKTAVNIVTWFLKPLPKKIREGILTLLDSFITGLQILHDTKNIIIASILSLAIWTPIGFIIYVLMGSFGIHLPIQVSFLLLVMLCLAVMIPSAPGFVGTIQFVFVAGLAIFDIPKSQALSFSFLFHATQFIPVTALGLIYLFVDGFSLTQLGKSSKEMQESAEEINPAEEIHPA